MLVVSYVGEGAGHERAGDPARERVDSERGRGRQTPLDRSWLWWYEGSLEFFDSCSTARRPNSWRFQKTSDVRWDSIWKCPSDSEPRSRRDRKGWRVALGVRSSRHGADNYCCHRSQRE